MEKNFTISSALRGGWEALKPNFLVLLGLMIGYVFLASLISWPSTLHPENFSLQIGTSLILMILAASFSLGYLKMCLDAVDGNEPLFSAFSETFRIMLPYIALYFLYVLIVLSGIILLIIPGIYLGIRLQFAPLCMIEGAGIMEAFKKSWKLSKGNMLKLTLLYLIYFGLVLAGIIVLIVGVFVAAVWCQLIMTQTYRLLQQDQEEAERLNVPADLS
ncbi:MAG: hypothetical protein ACK5JU_07025 [Bacteroidales bacterium]